MKNFLVFLVVASLCTLLIDVTYANYTENPEFIKICPYKKVLNENEHLNLSLKIFNIYDSVNANISVSLPSEFENKSFTKSLALSQGFNNFVFPLKVKKNVQYEGDDINIVIDGNKADWTNVTRNKTDSINDVFYDSSCSYSSNITSAYDIQEIRVNYNKNTDTIYFLILTNGTVGRGNGIDSSEQYAISIDNDNDSNTIELSVIYENNKVNCNINNNSNISQCNSYGNYSDNVIEMAITNASNIVNLNGFNIKASTNAKTNPSEGISCAISDCTDWHFVSFCKNKTLTNYANLTAYSEDGTVINKNTSVNFTVSCQGCNNTITCVCYRDADNDGYGNRTNNITVSGCYLTCSNLCGNQTPKYVLDNSDCNDNNFSIHPGATEYCGDGIDENCDGTDPPCTQTTTTTTSTTSSSYYTPSPRVYTLYSSGPCKKDTECGTIFCYKEVCYDPKGDEDRDKIKNKDERDVYKTDMLSNDTDKDKISDYDEIFVYKTDPLKDDDKDNDKIKDADEILKYKTDQLSNDTDNDKISDYDEIFTYKTDVKKADTDNDGLNDGDEINYKTDPLKDDDKDNDKIKDADEILKYKTNQLSNDTDNDKISDYDEIFTYSKYNVSPLSNDTDNDTYDDYSEINIYKTNPSDPKDNPGKKSDWWILPLILILLIIFLLAMLWFIKKKKEEKSEEIHPQESQLQEQNKEGGLIGVQYGKEKD